MLVLLMEEYFILGYIISFAGRKIPRLPRHIPLAENIGMTLEYLLFQDQFSPYQLSGDDNVSDVASSDGGSKG
jgi:hypothetical protein